MIHQLNKRPIDQLRYDISYDISNDIDNKTAKRNSAKFMWFQKKTQIEKEPKWLLESHYRCVSRLPASEIRIPARKYLGSVQALERNQYLWGSNFCNIYMYEDNPDDRRWKDKN